MLKLIAGGPGNCRGGSCPTIYETEKGSYVVQGKQVFATEEINLGPDENAVEIPAALIKAFLKTL